MNPIEVQVTQIPRFPGGPEVHGALMRGMTKSVMHATNQAKLNASGRPGPMVQTNRLRGSINGMVRKEGGEIVGVVGSNVIYARIQELGGVIVPVNASALRFRIGERWVTTQRVTIPARPYLAPAVGSPFMVAVISKSISDELKAVTGGA